jgi:hypothetical protein
MPECLPNGMEAVRRRECDAGIMGLLKDRPLVSSFDV